MLNFNEQDFLREEADGLALQNEIEAVVDQICDDGYSNLFWIGIGGTYAYEAQLHEIMKARSGIESFVEIAAEFTALGHRKLDDRSVLITSSVTGDTQEVCDAVRMAKEKGARIISFVGDLDTPLGRESTYPILATGARYYKLYFTALRFMYRAGDFDDYAAFTAQLQKMPKALVEVKKQFDPVAADFAALYADEPMHYVIGAGNLWGYAYCYSMCVMEECLWMRTKSVNAAEFFHGTLELIEKGVSVMVFQGEDDARPLTERVIRFAERVTDKLTILDTKDCTLDGIDAKYRGLLSPIVMFTICERMSKHLEQVRRHPLELRRYYRQLQY